MFGIPKDNLTSALEHMRQLVHCTYAAGASGRCDCKYGANTGERPYCVSGERGNGCPELRLAHRLISTLTEAEYAVICRRAGVEVSTVPFDVDMQHGGN